MKQKARNLTLAKETLRGLDSARLSDVVGGGYPTTTRAASMCNTYCVTGCGDTCVFCFTLGANATCNP